MKKLMVVNYKNGDTRQISLNLWENYGKKRVYIKNAEGKSKFASDMGHVDDNGEYVHGRNADNLRGITDKSLNEMVEAAREMLNPSEPKIEAEHHLSVGKASGQTDYNY